MKFAFPKRLKNPFRYKKMSKDVEEQKQIFASDRPDLYNENLSHYIDYDKVGDFYLFPNYMMHAVYPFADTNEERRSVSFNAKIDEKSASL